MGGQYRLLLLSNGARNKTKFLHGSVFSINIISVNPLVTFVRGLVIIKLVKRFHSYHLSYLLISVSLDLWVVQPGPSHGHTKLSSSGSDRKNRYLDFIEDGYQSGYFD